MGDRQSAERFRQDQARTGFNPGKVQPGNNRKEVAGSPIKLNLGCGPKHLQGFTNVDLAANWSGKRPDVEADATKTLPFPENYADEIHAYHFLEHIWRWKVDTVLMDWLRVLKPGGLLVLELPCLDKIIAAFSYYQQNKEPIEERLTLWGLYGDPHYKSEEMTHKWCWSVGELIDTLEKFGMKAELKDPQTHVAIRDMRIEAIKCQ